MELIFVTPLFLLLLFAVVEFTLLSTARMRILEAAQVAVARVCLTNGTESDVKSDVQMLLGPLLCREASIQFVWPEDVGDIAAARVTIPMRNATPDLLWPTGFSVKGRVLVAESVMVLKTNRQPASAL